MLFICNLIFLNDQNQEELLGNWKKEARNQEELKNKEKAWSAKFRSLKRARAKMALGCEIISQAPRATVKIAHLAAKITSCCEMVSQPPSALYENFRSCEVTPWHTSAIWQPRTPISQLRNGCETSMPWNPPFRSCKNPLAHECHFAAL